MRVTKINKNNMRINVLFNSLFWLILKFYETFILTRWQNIEKLDRTKIYYKELPGISFEPEKKVINFES